MAFVDADAKLALAVVDTAAFAVVYLVIGRVNAAQCFAAEVNGKGAAMCNGLNAVRGNIGHQVAVAVYMDHVACDGVVVQAQLAVQQLLVALRTLTQYINVSSLAR